MEFFRPLSSFPEIGSTPPKPQQYTPVAKRDDVSLRGALMGMLFVLVLISGGLYFFGSTLNKSAAVRASSKLTKDELAGFASEIQSQKDADAVEEKLNEDTHAAENDALNDFDLLKDDE